MSTFDRALAERLAELERSVLLRRPAVLDAGGPRVRLDGGREVVSFCSNDYLGLGRHPALAEAAAQAAAALGVGAGASRLVSGTHAVHRDAERRLARLVGRPAALLFSSAFAANAGALPALFGPEDLLISDARNHASLIDGCRSSRATVVVVPHCDLDAVRAALRAKRAQHRLAAVVTETLFSMDGDSPALAALDAVAREHDAALVLDEAHAIGVVGPAGAGAAAAAGVSPDVLVAGLGKAFGAAGGLVAGSAPLAAWLENRARTYVYSTAVSPVLAAVAARAATLVAEAEVARRELALRSARVRRALADVGLPVAGGGSPIVPVVLGSPERAVAVSARLLDAGYFVQAIRPPTVPEGSSRLRIAVTTAHTDLEVDGLVAALAQVL